MPKTIRKPPKNLRPYTFHGVHLNWEEAEANNEENVSGDCPFCGREEKFVVNSTTGQARCFVCGINGLNEDSTGLNHQSFLYRLHERSSEETTYEEYEKLSQDRGIRFPDTLMKFEVVKSFIRDEWLVPGFNEARKMTQLYRYVHMKQKDGTWKFKCLQTPELGAKMFGLSVWNSPLLVYICEGPWDAYVLYESLDQLGLSDSAAVLGLPGTNTFREEWANLFSGLKVNICFDNDYPDKNDRVGALEGVKRIASLLNSIEDKPIEINYVKWGETGYNKEYSAGFDVSDMFNSKGV